MADEVCNLTSKTQDTTKEIQQMIEWPQAACVMTHSREQSDMTAQSAEEAGESLVEIRNRVRHINEMNIQSATAAEEQCRAVNGKHCNI